MDDRALGAGGLQHVWGRIKVLIENAVSPLRRLQFTNVAVRRSAFATDSTFAPDYPYRARVSLSGVTAGMIPEVIFYPADAASGCFAPIAGCAYGYVYIYAARIPDADITVPTIICWKEIT